jgi:hypothetical protein
MQVNTPPEHETFTAEEKQAVEEQLERLLANSFFSHSRRFPAFLRFVIEKTLSGETEQLKERTLGIEIFGKDADYDTASDPIVRVTAAEIRKRIALYYQEPGHAHELRVSLPLGSYVPHFQAAETEPAERENSIPAGVEVVTAGQFPVRAAWTVWRWVAVAALLAVGIAGFAGWKYAQRSAVTEFWNPILASGDPVLFCVADQTEYKSVALRDAGDPSRIVTLQDTVTAVVIDDLSTITKIAGVMQTAGKRYTLRGEGETTLMDLRGGPSVIVGAFDNAWTLRLLQPLRFHFANDAAMTRFSIVDAKQPGKAAWTVDRGLQLATNNYRDYAIVARFTDETTGKPTLIAAGIGRGGTIAAGEFLTSPALLRAAESQHPAGKSENLEVVLSTQIINGEPGTPTIEAVYFW